MGVKLTQEQAEAFDKYVSSLPVEKRKDFVSKFSSLSDDGKIGLTSELASSSSGVKPKVEDKIISPDLNITLKNRMSEVDTDIKSRGDYLDNISSDMNSPNILRKGLGLAKTIGIPSVAIESGLSNPALAMQRGNFNPIDLASEAYKGATLQKQGQFGDIYRGAIPNKTFGNVVGATAGLGLSIVGPIKAFQAIKNSFGDVSKFNDKLIKGAGQRIVQSSDEAEKFVGESISNAYKTLDNTMIDGSSWTRAIGNIPDVVKSEVTRTIGDIDTLPPTIANMRKIKTLLGKYRPGNFDRGSRGLAENIEVDKIDEAYTGLKSVLTNTLSKKIGTKNTEKLIDLDETASKVYRATNELKNAVVNPRLLLPTRVGKVAKGLEDSGDISTREAMNIIRRGGGKQAKKLMNQAIRSLEIFNTREKAWKAAGKIVNYAVMGGAAGTAGSRILNKRGYETG